MTTEFNKLRNNAIGFFDKQNKSNNIVGLIERHLKNKPDEIAFIWADPTKTIQWADEIVTNVQRQSVTFRVFHNLIQRTAAGLKKAGIKKNDRVILFLPMSLQLYQTMAAIQMLGASAVFLDSWARRDQLGISAKIVGAAAMVSFEQAFALCTTEPELTKIPIKVVVGPHQGKYNASLEEILKNEPLTEMEPVEAEGTALITFTTGSSGVPKGANRTNQFLAAQHYALNECIPYNANDIDLPAFPIFSLNNLAAGVTTAIPITDIGRPSEKDSVMLASQILAFGVTCATLSPSMLAGLARYCDSKKLQLPKIRRVITGGAPISNDVLALMKKAVPNAKIWVLYGSTEVEPIAHIEAEDILNPKHGTMLAGEGVNVGHFAEGLEHKFLKIRKDIIELKNDSWAGLEVKEGEVGELAVAGLHVCKSYYNDPESVRKTKIVESNGKVWHRTGDLAYLDKNGNVWLVGRVHNAIFRDGKALFPVKVEILMKRHPFVRQSAFLGMPDEKLGEKAYALVQLNDEGKSKEAEIIADLKKALKKEGIPFDHAGAVEHIPMDPRHHSKVEYNVLRDALLKKG
ncbi:MAG: AMP-binding protein [Candidatus Riflebacteria bacterium]|nr:AMP-binding protein [Candidatus Riflebacteria bacterium]